MVGTPNQMVDTGGEGSRHAKEEEEECYWVWSACGSLEATDGYQQQTHHAIVGVGWVHLMITVDIKRSMTQYPNIE